MARQFNPNENREVRLDEAGEYLVELVDVQLWRADSGNEGLKMTFEVIYGKFTGAQINDTFWLSDAALRRFGSFSCLFHPEPFDLDSNEEVWAVFGGRRLLAKVASVVKDDGREFMEIKKYANPPKDALAKVVGVPRLAPAFPREDMLVAKSRERRQAPNRNTEYSGDAGDSSDQPFPTSAPKGGRGKKKGTLDDDIPF